MIEPRFTTGSVHGHHIEIRGIGLPQPAREPHREWSVYDRAYNARVVAVFTTYDGERRAQELAEDLNAENAYSLEHPDMYEPKFQEIIDAATDKESRSREARMRRNKGVRGEREVRRAFVDAGYPARNLEGKGDHIVEGHPLGRLHVEAKRQETLEVMKWMRQAIAEADEGNVPIVVFRRSREEWYVALRLSDFLGNGDES